MNLTNAHVDEFQRNKFESSCNMTDREMAAIVLFQNYPDGLLKFTVICYAVFMSIGIPGNLVTIIALARYEKVRNATAISIMNLSFSDLLFCCFNLSMIMSTFYHRSWAHGCLLCRVLGFARHGLGLVSLLNITMITINRYVLIAHPMYYPKLYRRRYLVLMLLSTWIFPFGTLTLTWFGKWGRFGLDVQSGTCSILPDIYGRTPKRILLSISLSLPLIAIIVCYARIFYIVKKVTRASGATVFRRTLNMGQEDSSSFTDRGPKSDIPANYVKPNNIYGISRTRFEEKNDTTVANDENSLRIDLNEPAPRFRRNVLRKSMILVKLSLPTRKDRKLGTMILAIMFSFCLCHLPITITKVFQDYTYRLAPNIVGYILLCMSTCLNPIIYVVMSSEYRKAYKNLFQRREK